MARAAASAYAEQGFDKQSAVWWGSDGQRFLRFVVADKQRLGGAVVISLLVGLVAIAAAALSSTDRRS